MTNFLDWSTFRPVWWGCKWINRFEAGWVCISLSSQDTGREHVRNIFHYSLNSFSLLLLHKSKRFRVRKVWINEVLEFWATKYIEANQRGDDALVGIYEVVKEVYIQ